MEYRRVRFVLLAAAALCATQAPHAQTASPIAGIWTLNRSASEFPKEIGFGIDLGSALEDSAPSGGGNAGGGRGRRGSNGGNSRVSGSPFAGRRESYEDGQRVRLITSEVRNPPSRLMIVDTPTAVTITNELGQSRTLHPDGKGEEIAIEGVVFTVTTKRDGDQLISTYHVEQDRDVTYTYSASASPKRLTVEAHFLEHGMGDKAARVYDEGTGAAAAPSSTRAAPLPDAGALNAPARETFDQRPNAEFVGLKSLGVLVEDLGQEATACGLRHDAIEDALTKRLSAGGLTVRRNSDDDTYVYVNIITSMIPSTGACVTRYDAFLYTHATAKLTYHDQPVLVQVSLMHRGGIGTSAAISHPGAITRGLEGYIDLFVQQIRDANK